MTFYLRRLVSSSQIRLPNLGLICKFSSVPPIPPLLKPKPNNAHEIYTKRNNFEELISQDEQKKKGSHQTITSTQEIYKKGSNFDELISQDEQKKKESRQTIPPLSKPDITKTNATQEIYTKRNNNFEELISQDGQKKKESHQAIPKDKNTQEIYTKGNNFEELILEDEQKKAKFSQIKPNTQKTSTKGSDYEEMILQDEQKKAEYKKIGVRFTEEQLNSEIAKIVYNINNKIVVSPEKFAHIIEHCDYQVEKAENLFSLAKQTNQLDSFVYNAMISVYTRSKKVKDAMQLLDTMPSPTHATFYFIINGFGKIGDVDNMFAALERMKSINIKPTVSIYNLLFEWCNELNKFVKVDEVFEMMKNDDIKPDNETYTILAPIYAGSEKLEELMVMLRDKKRVVISDSYATFVNSMDKALDKFKD